MNDFVCRELSSDDEIRAAYALMSVLRDRIRPDTFLGEVRRQQMQGYQLIGAFAADRLVGLAGVRRSHTLSRGEHLFVDDLVTAPGDQGRGYGTALLRWLAARAIAEDIPRVYLDSRDTAKGFYARIGLRFLTSVPCWIDAAALAGMPATEARR
jgi:GNAT superfamily N-acetyltransferase